MLTTSDHARSVPSAITLGVILMATALGPGPTAAASRGGSVERDQQRLETADWLPFLGRIRMTRTWGHPGGHEYPAIDFKVAAGKNAPIYAAGPGTVSQAVEDCPDTTEDGAHTDCNEGKGNFVEIAHPDGRLSRYLHLRHEGVAVRVGQHVCRGCPIGLSGWSGNVSPPGPQGGHLHYEELESFVTVNPGQMRAQHASRRVSYPGSGRSWERVGRKGLTLRNLRFPRPDRESIVDCLEWAVTRIGTPDHDEIRGTSGPDIIAGLGGNDSIHGLGGDDRLCGGAGDDFLVGGPGSDSIDGGDGTDTCFLDEEGGDETVGDVSIACEGITYELTVSVGCCLKVVWSDPEGISCPPDCSESYPRDRRVFLRLASGSSFWEGCEPYEGSSYGPTCTVVMTEPRLVKVQ